MPRHLAKAYLILFVGVAAFSTAATLIRLAQAPALVIAAYRLGVASLVVVPVAGLRARGELRALDRRELGLSLLAGVLLALHFALWITSLEYTSVASSVVLVTTTPVFVGLASRFLLRERLGWRMAGGILLSLAGGLVIGGSDLRLGGRAAWGDLLALAGAVMSSGYYLLGRSLRRRLSNLAYVGLNFPVAALALTLMCLVAGENLWGYAPSTYGLLVLLGLIPQLIGYSAINWALGQLSAAFVTVAILGEPVGATLLAWWVLGEAPALSKVIGGLLILGGIYVASRESAERA